MNDLCNIFNDRSKRFSTFTAIFDIFSNKKIIRYCAKMNWSDLLGFFERTNTYLRICIFEKWNWEKKCSVSLKNCVFVFEFPYYLPFTPLRWEKIETRRALKNTRTESEPRTRKIREKSQVGLSDTTVEWGFNLLSTKTTRMRRRTTQTTREKDVFKVILSFALPLPRQTRLTVINGARSQSVMISFADFFFPFFFLLFLSIILPASFLAN